MGILLWLFVVTYCIGYGAAVVHMLRYLRRASRIDTLDDLRAYARFVTVQKYSALLILAHLPVIVGLLFMADEDTPGGLFLPMLPLIAIGLGARRATKLQRRCRTLAVAPGLRVTYDRISHIWEAKALPRFPSLEEIAEVEASERGRVDCETHGPGVGASVCSRCGNYSCDTCATAGVLGQSRCAACRTRYEQRRTAGYPHECRVRFAGLCWSASGR